MSRFASFSLAVLASAALAACHGGKTSAAPVPSAPAAIAGEYAGPVTDSVAGAQTGTIVLAQHGSNAGGTMTLTVGATSTVESVALSLSGASFTGSGVMDVGGASCTFAIAGTAANGALSATYTGVSGCTRTGSWTLTQTCATTPSSATRRPEGVVPAC